MNKRLMSVVGAALTLAAAVAGLSQGSGAAAQGSLQSGSFADPAFQRVWTRTDQLVAQGQAGRSWFWGPQPRTAHAGAVAGAPGGQRLVQYFDKSRMEINDPNARPEQPLLRHQRPADRRADLRANADRRPAPTARAPRLHQHLRRLGRPQRADLRQLPQRRQRGPRHRPHRPRQARPGRHRRPSTATATSARTPAKSGVPGVTYAYYEPTTQHNIPQVFWDFLNQQRPGDRERPDRARAR